MADLLFSWRAVEPFPSAMTILVTGGAGYIGSHAVRALQQPAQPTAEMS